MIVGSNFVLRWLIADLEWIDFLSVAEKYDIIPHCRFNKTCLDLVWDSAQSLWVCTFQDTVSGEIFKHVAPVVISAIGTLDRPFVPRIEGAETFNGKIFHSARWDDTLETQGKNIVVLGNGASATQFVPELVKEVGPNGRVAQFVRSAHWWTKRVRLYIQYHSSPV
jgi:cation diffusion facilitator CzcD-associated flavoprotein CzcO